MKLSAVIVGVIAIALVGFAGAVSAKPALKDVAEVREGIIATGMAYEITQKCGAISPRYFRAVGYLNTLKKHASSLGYTDSEIDAYTNDKAEENRLKVIARARLAELGAVTDDEDSYCTVGRAEIAKNSVIGQLMR
ncbi:MAG: DUF5333 domain-containing protein [Yoonia sp.]|nr:DUF5333 domain-containing protein [Yoonia sp.]MDG1862599.1 DUF5333 domain-containing protein [Yoonia sp.]